MNRKTATTGGTAMRKIGILGLVGVLALVLAGCGGEDHHFTITGPGLVGIADRPTVSITAPKLTVRYRIPPDPTIFTAQILSDQPIDGDIAFDPVTSVYTVTKGPSAIFFGIDSADSHDPEYRAFLDFPLDGSMGGDIIPLNASIVSAWLKISVDFVDFAATVPVLLDLVQYPVATGLTSADYSSAFLASLPFDIFDYDARSDVSIEVTSLMIEAQGRGLADFQVRFLLGP
jgi:hypothetical protein